MNWIMNRPNSLQDLSAKRYAVDAQWPHSDAASGGAWPPRSPPNQDKLNTQIIGKHVALLKTAAFSLINATTTLFAALGVFSCEAGPVMIEAEVWRRAFTPAGKTFLEVRSTCSVTILGEFRQIRWEKTPLNWQEYWISPNGQQGFVVAPLMTDVTNAIVSRTKSGTNAVVAYDVQPRLASTEVQVIALSMFDSNLLAHANARGFLAPWGSEQMADALCFFPRATFNDRPPGMAKNIEILFDAVRWRSALSRWGPKKTDHITPPMADQEVAAALSVGEWIEIAGLVIPKRWLYERYAKYASSNSMLTNLVYRLEEITFVVHRAIQTAEVHSPPEIPKLMAVADFRAAIGQTRGVYHTSIGIAKEENESHRILLEGLSKDNDDRMRIIFGGKPETPIYRKYPLLLFLVPLLIFPFIFRCVGKHQRNQTGQ